MTERLIPPPPDPIVLVLLLSESVKLGHADSREGFAWAVEQGYIELVDEENFRILDAGREHVADQIVYPDLN
jgi:hypothetical protein